MHEKIPNPYFIVKVCKSNSNKYTGYSNIRVRDDDGFFECALVAEIQLMKL